MADLELLDAEAVTTAVLGAVTPTAAQTIRGGQVAAAINAEITTALDWPADRVATDGETADLVELAKLAAADLWKRRDAPFGVVAGFGGDTGAVVRVGRDPLETIRPALNRRRHGAAGNFG